MSNQECTVIATIVNININDLLFYPYCVTINKYSGRYSDINNPYSKLCVPDVVKDVNIEAFNLMSKTNETRYISSHETCSCKCRLDGSVCNDKERSNSDKCSCECKELIGIGRCNNGFIW